MSLDNSRQLIVNVDDFGLSHEVNRAVLDCYRAGTVSSATMLVNGAAAVEAVDIAKGCPDLGVGLHFNLTSGCPISAVSQVPGLVTPDGCFRGRRSFLGRWLSGKIGKDEVAKELTAQFERLVDWGLQPSHIDGHDHIHMVPLVFNTLAEFCIQMKIPLRVPWISTPTLKLLIGGQFNKITKKILLQATLKTWRPRISTNQSFISILDTGKAPELITIGDYADLLKPVQNNPVELMVHPAAIETAIGPKNTLRKLNKVEYELLSSPEFKTTLEKEKFVLTNYFSVSEQAEMEAVDGWHIDFIRRILMRKSTSASPVSK